MNKLLLIIGLIGLTLPFTRGGLEKEEKVVEGAAASLVECPTECFCDNAVHFATCIGDKTKTSLPLLSWLHLETRLRRFEAHDFVLSDIRIDDDDDENQNYKLFQMVEELYLSHNQIKSIEFNLMNDDAKSESEFFNNNNNGNSKKLSLLLLDLSFNNLSYFHTREEYKLLKSLDLSHNKIQRLQLNGLEKLESLNLKSNNIEELREDIFQTLKSIQYINLDDNLLVKLSPNLFSNLPSLAHLILSSNPLSLDSGFLFNSRTQFIDISNVGLQHIPSVMFRTVRDLRLNNNKLKRILESDFESYPNVGLLVLDENHIETIENDAFGRMDFLTSLWLNGNRLSSLPQNLPSSLVSLQLEENRITSLNSTSFTQLYNLETLNLHINQITSLDPEVFSSLYNLRTLNLRSNLIDSIYKDTFKNLTKLTHLDLSLNPIKVIVNEAFNHFPKLQSFHLARINEKEIEFSSSIFDKLDSLQILDLSNSAYFAYKIFSSNIFSRGWLKSLRELDIERCDLKLELSTVCTQLLELDSLVNVKVQGNSFNTSVTTGSSTSVMLRQVVTATTTDSSSNNNSNDDDNLNSLQKLCHPFSRGTVDEESERKNKVKERTVKPAIIIGQGDDETSLQDLEKEEKLKTKKKKKVSLTLTTTTTSTSTTTESPSLISTIVRAVTISSKKVSQKVPSTTTILTRRSRPTSRSSNATTTTNSTQKIMQEESPTISSSTSTSSYFELPPTNSKTTTKKKMYLETNEETSSATSTTGEMNRNTTQGRRREPKEELGSIDGFPADLSGRTTTSSSTGTSNISISFIHGHNDHDFAKGSFHGLLPQKMYLSQSSALTSTSSTEDNYSNTSLILKTIFISAGTCLLSVFILLAFGLLLFRLNGGRFVRNSGRSTESPTSESYRRLEEKQELELSFSNKMYYDGGQVYHIS